MAGGELGPGNNVSHCPNLRGDVLGGLPDDLEVPGNGIYGLEVTLELGSFHPRSANHDPANRFASRMSSSETL